MKKKNTSLYLVALLAVAILIGVGYAALSATLNINGQTKINKASWDVHFENISTNDPGVITFYLPNDTDMSGSSISNISGLNATTLNYSINLTGPDPDKDTTHDMTVDVVNKGTMDATISNVTLPSSANLTSVYPSNAAGYVLPNSLTITCTYSDGTTIKTGDKIPAGSSKTITCKHHYKSPSELDNNVVDGWGSISSDTITAKLLLSLNFTAE